MGDANTGTDPDLRTRRLSDETPSLRSEDRLALQDYDAGDPSDPVYVVDSFTSKSYHDDTECPLLNTTREDCESMPRSEAQRKWLAPCQVCADLVAPAEVAGDE
ncbi:hypothetical protein BRD18_04270 [Halobacteriales archaeon SW_7_71_33]|nr:MAG: hypothetical protein BRD18_04270 [Halobacteriales archaeon SW_7_71_33]